MINNPGNGNPNQIGQQPTVQISAKEFQAKYRSKREIFNFLAGECELFLPPYGKTAEQRYLILLFL